MKISWTKSMVKHKINHFLLFCCLLQCHKSYMSYIQFQNIFIYFLVFFFRIYTHHIHMWTLFCTCNDVFVSLINISVLFYFWVYIEFLSVCFIMCIVVVCSCFFFLNLVGFVLFLFFCYLNYVLVSATQNRTLLTTNLKSNVFQIIHTAKQFQSIETSVKHSTQNLLLTMINALWSVKIMVFSFCSVWKQQLVWHNTKSRKTHTASIYFYIWFCCCCILSIWICMNSKWIVIAKFFSFTWTVRRRSFSLKHKIETNLKFASHNVLMRFVRLRSNKAHRTNNEWEKQQQNLTHRQISRETLACFFFLFQFWLANERERERHVERRNRNTNKTTTITQRWCLNETRTVPCVKRRSHFQHLYVCTAVCLHYVITYGTPHKYAYAWNLRRFFEHFTVSRTTINCKQ